MSALWDPRQREWLRAMGYRVWHLDPGGPPPALEADAVAVAAPPAMRDAGRDRPAQVAAHPPAPAGGDASAVGGAGRQPAPSPTGAERRLYRALLRATGQRTTRAAEALLAQLALELPALRRDPAAKRALWLRLRALRKASGRR